MTQWRIIAVIMLLCVALLPTFAQDDNVIPLEPVRITDELFTVAPQNWTRADAGVYVAEDNLSFISFAVLFGDEYDARLTNLLNTFTRDGNLPEVAGMIVTQTAAWQLYPLTYIPDGTNTPLAVDLALTNNAIVVLQATPENYATYRQQVFNPVLDTFALSGDEAYAYLNADFLEESALPQFGLQTVTPITWIPVNIGAYRRSNDPTDPTTLLIQSSPDLSADEFGTLLVQQLGFADTLPDERDSYQADTLTWSIAQVQLTLPDGDVVLQIALADADDLTLLVALLSTADETSDLRESILLPVLAATVPNAS